MNISEENESPDLTPTHRSENQPVSESAPSASSGRTNATAAVPAIPDHELLRRIGQGSYGEVWLARNVLGDYRAVKVVYRRTFESARPFDREFEGIKRFEPISRSHESQVQILHVGRAADDSCFYYIMELADGIGGSGVGGLGSGENQDAGPQSPDPKPKTPDSRRQTLDPATYSPRNLRSEIQRCGRLPPEECLEIALKLTRAGGHLHQHGLIHRDIKPSNVIFVNGVPKLADIGLVAQKDSTVSFVGTRGIFRRKDPAPRRRTSTVSAKCFTKSAPAKIAMNFPTCRATSKI